MSIVLALATQGAEQVECAAGMGTVLSTAEQAQVRELLDVLGPRATQPPRAMPALVLTYLRVAQWLHTPHAPPRDHYATALFMIAEHADRLSFAIEALDAELAATVLKDAVTFIDEAHAPALADAMAARNLIPGPRLARLLARTDLARCVALLERIDRALDARTEHVESVAAAYLEARRSGAVPDELSRIWRELDARPAASWAPALAAARLEIAALEEPGAVLARLLSTLEEHGASRLGGAPAAVVAAVLPHDRAAVVALAEDGWPVHRAIMAEAIALADPKAPELPAIVDDVLRSWLHDDDVIHTPADTIELTLPLLATTLLLRDDARARSAVRATQPSRFMLNVATRTPMQKANLADLRWRPGLWDDLAK